jgi:hypothetical protein
LICPSELECEQNEENRGNPRGEPGGKGLQFKGKIVEWIH